jgi:hypothetical protein
VIPYIDPRTNATTSLRDVCSRRRGEAAKHVRAAQRTVLARYNDYLCAAPTFDTLAATTLLNPQADAIRGSYRYQSQAIQAIDAAARGAQPAAFRNICPLCGFGEPSTMDHALPRSDFPEYSVFPLNLVPACGKCNTDKGEEWRDASGKRHLHAYLDALPAVQFLFMDVRSVTVGAPTIHFRVGMPPGTEAGLANRIRRHFEVMDLEARYITKAVGTMAEYQNIAPRTPGRSRNEFRAELEKDRARKAATWGVNYWETVTLAGLRDSLMFLQHLESLAR